MVFIKAAFFCVGLFMIPDQDQITQRAGSRVPQRRRVLSLGPLEPPGHPRPSCRCLDLVKSSSEYMQLPDIRRSSQWKRIPPAPFASGEVRVDSKNVFVRARLLFGAAEPENLLFS